MDIQHWREEIKNCFPDLLLPAEIGLSVVGQLFIKDIKHPFGLIYVDVSSSGKTIVLNFFSSLKELVYILDNLTKASFVSQSGRKSKEDLEKEVDLLPKIKDKVLLVRDLAPLFSKKEEELTEILGQLIRVMDGQGYKNTGGIHGSRGYEGEYNFMFLGASTPISKRVWNIMNRLGSRLVTFNLNNPDKNLDALVEQNISVDSLREKEKRCREITKSFIQDLQNQGPVVWERQKEDKELLKTIARISQLLACLRAVLNEDRIAEVEKSDRLNYLLYNFARGHAFICKRKKIDKKDIYFVIKIALSSALMPRVKIIDKLLSNRGRLTAKEIMPVLKCSLAIALKYMKELECLGVVRIKELNGKVGRPEQQIILLDQWEWFLGEEFKGLRGNP